MSNASTISSHAAAPDRATVDDAFAHCREVTRREARNFFYGMKLTPEPKRSAMYAVYAWMRAADDIADEAGSDEQKQKRLARFRYETHRIFDSPDMAMHELPEGRMWPAVHLTVHAFGIPRQHFDGMLDGQLADQHVKRYRTWDELYDYCFKVASVVGLTCIHVWGFDGSVEAERMAEQRGVAFQLTNILRDVREDAHRGRIYLPCDLLDMTDIEPRQVLGTPSVQLVEGVRGLGAKAQSLYEQSNGLEAHLHPDGRACALAMRDIYRGLLGKIMHDPQRVFDDRRVTLGPIAKSFIALRAPLRARLGFGRDVPRGAE